MSEEATLPEIVTELPQSFLDEFENDVKGRVPEEKVQVELRQQMSARIMAQTGSLKIEGLGQRVASIDPRLYFRMQSEFGQHEGWLKDFLADNPELCAPGYRPKRKGDLRHAKTFVGGKPV
jgi:hypothetical protein